jgi:hypothetical protein
VLTACSVLEPQPTVGITGSVYQLILSCPKNQPKKPYCKLVLCKRSIQCIGPCCTHAVYAFGHPGSNPNRYGAQHLSVMVCAQMQLSLALVGCQRLMCAYSCWGPRQSCFYCWPRRLAWRCLALLWIHPMTLLPCEHEPSQRVQRQDDGQKSCLPPDSLLDPELSHLPEYCCLQCGQAPGAPGRTVGAQLIPPWWPQWPACVALLAPAGQGLRVESRQGPRVRGPGMALG